MNENGMTVDHRWRRVVILFSVLLVLFQTGCSGPIPREDVPAGWALDVHQPGEWWTQRLVPRAVIVQRCPPPRGWASEPDLTRVTALPPGGDVEYSFLGDDYHCLIGWSEPTTTIETPIDDPDSEHGLRRICSSSGLPMDTSWRYLGHSSSEQVGDLPSGADGWTEDEATAGFIDEYGTVVACLVSWGDSGSGAIVELSVGADLTGSNPPAACPVSPRNMTAADDGSVSSYQLRGTGAVRDDDGHVLTRAKTLRIGLVADSVTSSHPVVDGIAIVDVTVWPRATFRLDWNEPPKVQGEILDGDGRVLATCRA